MLTGQALGRDPIAEAGGLNLYGFLDNNALDAWDYLGLECERLADLGFWGYIGEIAEALYQGAGDGALGIDDALSFGYWSKITDTGTYDDTNYWIGYYHGEVAYDALSFATGTWAEGMVFNALGKTSKIENVINAACFVAGTEVHTPTGLKAIENIKTGDIVLSSDPGASNKVFECKVLDAFSRTSSIYVLNFADGQEIKTTAEHPFWVKSKGWTPVKEMTPGNEVITIDGRVVQLSHKVFLEKSLPVFNITVDNVHSYFVGKSGILVHNADRCAINAQKSKVWQNPQVDRIAKDLKLTKDQRNILHREITGENLKFNQIKDIAKQIKDKQWY